MSNPNTALAAWQLAVIAVVSVGTLAAWLIAVYLADRQPPGQDRAAAGSPADAAGVAAEQETPQRAAGSKGRAAA